MNATCPSTEQALVKSLHPFDLKAALREEGIHPVIVPRQAVEVVAHGTEDTRSPDGTLPCCFFTEEGQYYMIGTRPEDRPEHLMRAVLRRRMGPQATRREVHEAAMAALLPLPTLTLMIPMFLQAQGPSGLKFTKAMPELYKVCLAVRRRLRITCCQLDVGLQDVAGRIEKLPGLSHARTHAIWHEKDLRPETPGLLPHLPRLLNIALTGQAPEPEDVPRLVLLAAVLYDLADDVGRPEKDYAWDE